MTENDDTKSNDRPAGGGAGFDDDRLLALALGLADDPELVAAAAADAELGRRLDAIRADVGAVRDGVNAAVPAPDDSYTDLSQERWRGLAPYLQVPQPGRQPRRPRPFFHRALAPAVALLTVAAILGGVLALSHRGGPSTSTGTLAAKGNSTRAPEAAPGAPTGAAHMPSPVTQGSLAAAYDTVVVARAGQISGAQQRFTVLRILKGTAPEGLHLRSEGDTLPPRTLAVLYLGLTTGAKVPAASLGLIAGTVGLEKSVQTPRTSTPQPAASGLTQRVPAPRPVVSPLFGPASLAVTPYVFRHGEALAVPLPPGSRADTIRLP